MIDSKESHKFDLGFKQFNMIPRCSRFPWTFIEKFSRKIDTTNINNVYFIQPMIAYYKSIKIAELPLLNYVSNWQDKF